MNLLEYSVAWIDDQPQQAKGHEDGLRAKLARQGLDLRVEWITDEMQLKSFLETLNEESDYDLILVDWRVGQMTSSGSGATIAKCIRDLHSYANIIFYSAATPHTLRAEIAKQLIDGVWCVNREYFGHEAWHTIQASLRRIDINAMRGLFVAAVAEFDHKMKGALMKAYDLLDDTEKNNLKTSLVNRKLTYARAQLTELEKCSTTESLARLLEKVKAGTFDLFALLQELNGMVSAIDARHKEVTSLLGKFEADVITPRNDLAHAKTTTNGGKKTITRAGRTYDWPKFSELRTQLLEHHENLHLIADKYVAEIAAQLNKPKE